MKKHVFRICRIHAREPAIPDCGFCSSAFELELCARKENSVRRRAVRKWLKTAPRKIFGNLRLRAPFAETKAVDSPRALSGRSPAAFEIGERMQSPEVLERMNSDSTDDSLSKLKLQGIHVDLTEAMQETIRDKFATLLRHNEYIVRVDVRLQRDQTLGTEGHYRGTARIEIAGPDLVASADGKEAYAVIDQLVDRLDRQLEKRHERRKDRRNHPHATEIETALPKVE
jgi:putative sigma-54 modulation protein